MQRTVRAGLAASLLAAPGLLLAHPGHRVDPDVGHVHGVGTVEYLLGLLADHPWIAVAAIGAGFVVAGLRARSKRR